MKIITWISAIFLGLGTSLAITAMSLASTPESLYSTTKIIGLDQIVGIQYFKESDYSDRVEGLYAGYVASLEDANTMYLSAEKAQIYKMQQQGQEKGVGIKFSWGISSQYLVVTEVIENSPAYFANIAVGDRILQIDDTLCMLSNELEIYEKLTYTGEDSVIYTIQKQDKSITEVPLIPTYITYTSVKTQILDEDIGYIEVINLNTGSTDIIKNQIESFKYRGVNSFILDVRYLDDAKFEEVVLLTDLFMDDGIMFSSVDKQGKVIEYASTTSKINNQVAILTNSTTAGTIEIMVEALKPDPSIFIVGNSTKGIGTASEFIELDDGSALIISTKQLYVDNLEQSPIEPEVVVSLDTQYTLNLVTYGTKDITLDNQITTAINILKGEDA
ncbi:MAG: hypothetical protein BEN19_01915 [Epulopiscium sp. Nuni2H_MBin003]|nr:MAG: hypothetical protein BEN19_01915 [Epulopiscium sp. Nuni2H_MBin003]